MTASNIPESLDTLAEQALANARREMEKTGRLNPAIFFQLGTGEIIPLKLTDEMAEAGFGSADRRDFFFRSLRAIVEASQATAVVLVNDIWTGKQTEKFNALSEEEKRRTIETAPDIATLTKAGLATRCEAIMVQIQTPEQFTIIEQMYERDRGRRQITWGTRDVKRVPQEDCDGRIKLFGKVTKV